MRENNRDRNSNAILAGRNCNLAVDEVKKAYCKIIPLFYDIL